MLYDYKFSAILPIIYGIFKIKQAKICLTISVLALINSVIHINDAHSGRSFCCSVRACESMCMYVSVCESMCVYVSLCVCIFVTTEYCVN